MQGVHIHEMTKVTRITTANGKPGQRNDSLRNVVEYKVIYDAESESWLVQDQVDMKQTC